MRYDNSTIRRQNRLLDEARATELLRTAEYGFLSVITDEDKPYGIPINFAWDGQESIYVHCAPEGKKLRAIASHAEVSFCVVGRVHLLPSQFSTEYESIILCGTATTDLPAEERMKALRLLLEKLSPNDIEVGMKFAEKSFGRTAIIRIDVEKMSGKTKRVKG